MADSSQIIGPPVQHEIRRGTSFDTISRLHTNSEAGIATRLGSGFRAITVALTETNVSVKSTHAGQMVDVLFHYAGFGDLRNSEELQPVPSSPSVFQSATVTLVQNIEVLALHKNVVPSVNSTDGSTEGRVLVTLCVKLCDAETIRVAEGNGELSLSLRPPNDQGDIRVACGRGKMEISSTARMATVEFKNAKDNSFPESLESVPRCRELPVQPSNESTWKLEAKSSPGSSYRLNHIRDVFEGRSSRVISGVQR